MFTYVAAPRSPNIGVRRLDPEEVDDERETAHTHDFLVIAYYERGGGRIRVANRQWTVESGDVYIVAPGEVVAASPGDERFRASGWAAYFAAEALGVRAPGPFLAWRSHPLLLPFVRNAAAGAQRLRVPESEREAWSDRFAAIARELDERHDGFHEASMAYLTLLLVSVARLASDVVGDLKLNDEPLLSAVFEVIEQRFREPISLRDVASAVFLSSGHLTTVVRRKTGRTVLEWITERRLAEARRLLVESDLAVDEVGRAVGFRDSRHFTRTFGKVHGFSPGDWRRMSCSPMSAPTAH